MRITPKLAWILGSLAPAAACLFLTVSIFNSGNSGISQHGRPMIAAIFSNQDGTAYSQARENSLFSVTFDWTNHGGLISSMASFPQGKTNY
jgi:hypothetical protein